MRTPQAPRERGGLHVDMSLAVCQQKVISDILKNTLEGKPINNENKVNKDQNSSDNVADGNKIVFRTRPLKYRIISKAKWDEVKMSFVQDGIGPKILAEMYGVNVDTIHQRISRKGWRKERDEYRRLQAEKQVKSLDDEIGELREKMTDGKQGCIDQMLKIAQGLLLKLEARVRTLASNDDREINRTTESMVRLYGVLEPLLGIGKGEGNRDKVKPNQVQAEILESAMEAVDALKAH